MDLISQQTGSASISSALQHVPRVAPDRTQGGHTDWVCCSVENSVHRGILSLMSLCHSPLPCGHRGGLLGLALGQMKGDK